MSPEELAPFIARCEGRNGGGEAETVLRLGNDGDIVLSTFRGTDAARAMKRNPAAIRSVSVRGLDGPELGEVVIRLDPAFVRGVEMLIKPEKGEPMSDEEKAAFRDRFAPKG